MDSYDRIDKLYKNLGLNYIGDSIGIHLDKS